MDLRLPYYMMYPIPYAFDEDKIQKRDREYLQSMYPATAKKIFPYIQEECDRQEYEGSMIYDEYPDKLQRAVGTGIFQPAALTGLEDDEVLLLGGQHHLTAPEHTAAPHDQKQIIICAGIKLPDGALLKKITLDCIVHQKNLRETVMCNNLLYTTEKYNCYNCIIHQFVIVFNHFLDMY